MSTCTSVGRKEVLDVYGLDAFRADLLFFAGVVQTKTARQSVLSETSKTSGKWHCISMIKKIWTPQFDIINDG